MVLAVKIASSVVGWIIAYAIVWVFERNKERRLCLPVFPYLLPALIIAVCLEHFTGIFSFVWLTLMCVGVYFYLKHRYRKDLRKEVRGDELGTRPAAHDKSKGL